jgi:hypothetical protein
MTPNEQTNATGVTTYTETHRLGSIKAVSTICLLAGIWFFVSPWIYRAEMDANLELLDYRRFHGLV